MPHDALDGPDFYDTAAVSQTYLGRREAADHANSLMEVPHVLDLAGAVTGLEIADLGCGDARFGEEVLRRGAARYWGLEGSTAMARAARRVLQDHEPRAAVQQGRIEDWSPEPQSFDLVVSRMALHYVADLRDVVGAVARALRPTGRFVLSVEHPVVTSCYDAADPDDFPERWVVRDYFARGQRQVDWLGATSRKHHRTIEDHLDALARAGLELVGLREGDPFAVDDGQELVRRRRRHVPMYLVIGARRRASESVDAVAS